MPMTPAQSTINVSSFMMTLNPSVAAMSRRYASISSATRAADHPSSPAMSAAAGAAALHP